jgi:hypothetical protein
MSMSAAILQRRRLNGVLMYHLPGRCRLAVEAEITAPKVYFPPSLQVIMLGA